MFFQLNSKKCFKQLELSQRETLEWLDLIISMTGASRRLDELIKVCFKVLNENEFDAIFLKRFHLIVKVIRFFLK